VSKPCEIMDCCLCAGPRGFLTLGYECVICFHKINKHSHAHMHKVNSFWLVNNRRPEISSQKTRHQPHALTLWPETQSSELSVSLSHSLSLSPPFVSVEFNLGFLGRRLKHRQSYQHLCKQ